MYVHGVQDMYTMGAGLPEGKLSQPNILNYNPSPAVNEDYKHVDVLAKVK